MTFYDILWGICCFVAGYNIDYFLREKYQDYEIEGEFGEPTVVELIIYDIIYKLKGLFFRQTVSKDPFIRFKLN